MENINIDFYRNGKEGFLYYSNDINSLPGLTKLSKSEIKIFFAACYLYQRLYLDEYWKKVSEQKEKQDETLGFTPDIDLPTAEFSYKELQSLINYRGKDNDRFGDIARSMRNKLQGIAIETVLKSSTSIKKDDRRMILFPTIDVLDTKKTVRFGGNPDFIKMLFGFTRSYTEIEIEQLLSLKHIYSIHCYRLLKQWRSTGCWIVSIERFRQIMGLGESYTMSNIDQKVFSHIAKDLSPYFNNYKMEKVYDDNKKGRPIKTLIFSFEPQTKEDAVITCPKCGEPLAEKMVNGSICWCHKDGWKEDAKCKAIFNTIAEIKEYKEIPERLTPEEYKDNISRELLMMFDPEEKEK